MRSKKNKILILISLLACVLIFTCLLTACDEDKDTNEINQEEIDFSGLELNFYVDGNFIETISAESLKDGARPNIPSKDGYFYDGRWAIDEECDTIFLNLNEIDFNSISDETLKQIYEVLKQNNTLYTKLRPISYSISYNLGRGFPYAENNPNFYSIETDTFTLNNPYNAGYEFLGWSGTDIDGCVEMVTIPKGSAGNREYVANWEPIYSTLSYELNGGIVAGENPIRYSVETPTFTLINPTKEGYIFVGWTGTYLDNPETNVIINHGTAGNRHFVANWEINLSEHDIVHHDGQEATCTENGWKPYDTCTKCDYTTYEEISASHDIVHHDGQEATCTENGWKPYDTCTKCDYTTYEEIPATGHNFVNDICTKCGEEKNEFGFEFSLSEDKTAYILKRTTKRDITNIVIPSQYKDLPVTSIGDYAFYEFSELTSITIPNSVTSIGYGAFFGCSGLTSIVIPSSVINIGECAFQYCSGLTSIVIPDSVTNIGDGTFYGCSSLTSITIPNSVTSIGGSAFSECTGLTSITIPDSVTSIGQNAFSNCSELTSITIPSSVTSIGYDVFSECNNIEYYQGSSNWLDYISNTKFKTVVLTSGTSIGSSAFYGCTNLTKIEIPNSVTSIGSSAFSGCTGLTNIEISNSVTSIWSYAFSGCTGLTNIEIPNSVTSIESNAFNGCIGLTSIVIPNSVTIIGMDAFSGCSELTSITLPDSLTNMEFVFSGCDNVKYYQGPADWINYINKTKLETVVLTSGTRIHNFTFYECTGLTSIVIPDSVIDIGEGAFRACTSLTSITIGNGVESIGDNSFYGCYGLTSITIGNNVTSIGVYAFNDCSALTSITIGNGVESIGSYAFSGCSALTSVYITDIAAWCNISFGDEYANPLYYAKNLYLNGELLADLLIPNTVTEIKYGVFYNCTSLANIVIPSSVTSIGNYAFARCTGLTSIVIPDSVTNIGDGTFYGCSSLTSITIPNSVTSIGGSAFSECSGLTSIVIPNSVTGIGYDVFSGCDNVEYYQGPADWINYINRTKLETVVLTSGTRIENSAFIDCIGLTSITIPNSVTSIGSYAFARCSALTSIVIPNSVTSIGDSAFSECTGLTSITIGNNVTSIGGWAFYGCSALNSVNWNAINCTTAGSASDPIFNECIKIAVINIGSNVNTIPNYAFCELRELTRVEIPNSVTSIGSYAFFNCRGLTSITIPDSVTNIGSCAFAGCTSLITIIISDNVKNVGEDAFSRCDNVEYYQGSSNYVAYIRSTKFKIVDLTSGTSIGAQAFLNCKNLTSVKISNSVTDIGLEAFINCTGLTSITIPDSVTSIGQSAFSNCSGLTSITISSSVTSIGNFTFNGCSGLTSITIPDRVTSIGTQAFNNCSGLTSITIPDSVTNVGYWAFSGCSALINVTIGNSVTNIEGEAFSGCSGLTSITIGNGVESIGSYAFSGCSALKSVYITDIAAWCNISFGDKYANPLYYAKNLYLNGELLVDLIIPNTVTEIKNYAFYNCTSVTSITIGNGVESIGSYAFGGCDNVEYYLGPADWINYINRTKLETVVLTSGTSIGQSAFSNCSGLSSIVIPDSVTSIGDSAFYNCSGLTSITIPSTVTSIGGWAFSGCSGLTSIVIPDSVTSIGSYAFSGCNNIECYQGSTDWINDINKIKLKTLVLTSGTSIGSYAFQSRSLTSVTIGNSVTSIGSCAFSSCSALTSVTIGNSVTSIEYEAFYNCSGLTSITIPSSVTSIGSAAFYNCYRLVEVWDKSSLNISAGSTDNGYVGYYALNVYTENGDSKLVTDENGFVIYESTILVEYIGNETNIAIPNAIQTIYQYAFFNCSGLTNVVIPDGLTDIGDYAFYNCSGLANITIPNSVTSIGMDAFYNCSALTSIVIPNGVTSIGNDTFRGCGGLTSIVIPSSVTSIGNYAFCDCSGLVSIEIPNSVISIGSSAFAGCSGLTSITLPFVGGSKSATSASSSTLFGHVFGGNPYTGGTLITQRYNSSNNLNYYYIPTSLKSVTITGGNILYGAFYGCSGLTSITIPNAVTRIDSYAFYNCSGLTSITIPESITSIGERAFENCYRLVEVWDKSSLDISAGSTGNGWVGYYALNVYTENGDSKLVTDENGFVIYESTILVEYIGNETNIAIPNAIQTIYQYAFFNCRGLTNIVIPDSLTGIGDYAFHNCTSLTSVTIGNSVESIGNFAFYNCSGLVSIEISDSVTSIGNVAFYNCSALTNIVIPNSVTSIGNSAFYGCSKDLIIYCEVMEKPDGWDEEWNINNLSVVWQPGYTITYNLNGGINNSSNPSKYTIKDVITLQDPTKITKVETSSLSNGNFNVETTQYTFQGWYLESTFDTKVETISGNENIEIYAKWSETTTTTTEQLYTKEDNYIYFGLYPQAKVTEDATITALNNLAGTLPTSDNNQAWTSYGYYQGNGPANSGSESNTTNYMWYIDKEYSGEKYRGVYFTSYRPSLTFYSSNADYSNQDDNGYYTSTVYWFKYEPIKWRILSETNGEALILCDMIIDSQDYYYTTIDHSSGAAANDWAESTIRAWLNDTFYNTAFTDSQKALILEQTLTTDKFNGGTEETNDKVFLLTQQDVLNSSYGFSTSALISDKAKEKKTTDYAQSQGAYTTGGNGCWWLRSPNTILSSYEDEVDGSAKSSSDGVLSTGRGVVPALKIKLD